MATSKKTTQKVKCGQPSASEAKKNARPSKSRAGKSKLEPVFANNQAGGRQSFSEQVAPQNPASAAGFNSKTYRNVAATAQPDLSRISSAHITPREVITGLKRGRPQPPALPGIAFDEASKSRDQTLSASSNTSKTQPLSKRVFLAHGHDKVAKQKVARFLEEIGLEPVILQKEPYRGKTNIEKFECHSNVGFAIVLLTPDDTVMTAGKTAKQRARQNVILELGYFLGKLGRSRISLVKTGKVEMPSNIKGMPEIDLDVAGWRPELACELEAASYDIDWKCVRAGD
jgi:hypothetical protein